MPTKQFEANLWIFRIGAVAAVLGSLLGMVGNIIHPQTPTGNQEGVARAIADSGTWALIHLAIIAGLILMLVGLIAISRSIKEGLAGALAWLGGTAAIAGITVGLVLVTLDGFAAKHIADFWAIAPPENKTILLQLTVAQETTSFALVALFNILFAGVTYILLGLAAVFSRVYPRWPGWVAVIAGLGSIVVGTAQAITGESTTISQALTIIFPTVITLWTVLMGVLLYRKACVLARASHDK